ncbi:MAG: tetratricopeptide repeat protein, partial [Chitinophagaceae bacterium]
TPPYALLTDSIKKNPKRDDIFFRRAVLLNKNNLPEPALADFHKAWLLNNKEEKYAYAISKLLMDKNSDSAIIFLGNALKDLPNSFLLQLNLARAYDAIDKTDDALKICDDILSNNPEKVDALKLKANLLDKINDEDKAINTLEKAYALAPFDIDLNYTLAEKYAESNNKKVIALCDSLISKDSMQTHAEPYYYKGIYYSNLNNNTIALVLFGEAIRRNYNFLPAYIEKGRVLYEQKKINEAMKTFQLANTISATFPDAYFWMGKCQEAMGQKDDARLNYQRAYSLDNTFTEAKEAADKINN